MCGITGIASVHPRNNSTTIVRMTDAIAHRGPDDFGYIALNPGEATTQNHLHEVADEPAHVFLGHRRLSIIDVKGTKQPLRNEDGSIWVVFNGEIYNYAELSELLTAQGHFLRNKGDTEVLVHLWEEYREHMLEHLVGMFAFAVYDVHRRILFLARDRFGQKPLFYWKDNEIFAFASELQCFLKIDSFPNHDNDPIAIAQYFRYGYIPHPRTVYKNTGALPPGSYAILKNNKLLVKQYWKPKVTGDTDFVDYNELQRRFDDSVRLRLRTDVPLGMFLSGGIDSALIAASSTHQLEEPPQTFTISTGKNWCDESQEAQITAQHLQSRHRTLQIEPDIVETSNKLAKHYGQPFADFSSIPTYYLSSVTGQFVKVALTGDGGDELFAGYGQYLHTRYYDKSRLLPNWLKHCIAASLNIIPFVNSSQLKDQILSFSSPSQKGENHSPLYHQYWRERGFSHDFTSFLTNTSEQDIARFVHFYYSCASENPVDKCLECDQRMYLCDDILTKVDIAAMAVSLECRAPFLDHRFAEYANIISSKEKIRHNTTKYPLKELAKRRLPKELLGLPKKGFTLPLAVWLRTSLKEWAYSIIFDNTAVWDSYLERNFVCGLWKAHQKGIFNHQNRLWLIIALCLWHEHNQS